MNEVCIVGAGIGGLTLAYELEKLGRQVVIVEESNRLGGAIRSERRDGFLLEYAANSAAADPEFTTFIDELGLKPDLAIPSQAAKEKYVAVRSGNRLTLAAAPRAPLTFFTSKTLSPSGKLRALGEPFIPRTKKQDESAAEFVRRRFGPEIFENLAAAVLNGIWAGDPDRMSARSTLPTLWEIEQKSGSLTRGLLGRAFGSPFPRRTTVSFRNGMEQLPAALGAKLKTATVHTGASVKSVSLESEGWRARILKNGKETESIFADVVLTGSSAGCATILRDFAPECSEKVALVPAAPIGVLHLALPKGSTRQPLNGFGALVPPQYRYALLGVLFSSAVFENRAPAGRDLLTCFCGGMLRPEFSDVTVTETRSRVISEVEELLGFRDPPQVLDATFIRSAIPNYEVGHYEIQKVVTQLCDDHPGLHILAAWFRGTGVVQRVAEAKKLAATIAARVHASRERRRAG